MKQAVSIMLVAMAVLAVANSASAKEYSMVPGVELELAYAYLGVSADSDFVAIGEWNGDGNEFGLATDTEGSPIGAQIGARMFFDSKYNTGLGAALRLGVSTAKIAIDWSDNGEDVDEISYFFSGGATLFYKLPIKHPRDGNGIYIMPEVGFEYDYFVSEPSVEGEEENKDKFSIGSPALIGRLGAEIDVTDKIGVFSGFEYHYQFAWSATRTFEDESEVTGDLEGSASLWRFYAGLTF